MSTSAMFRQLVEPANPTVFPHPAELNPTSGGGEQVSLSVGQQGSKAQPFTFNRAPNSNEEIVLNLLGAASSSSTPSSSPANGSSAIFSPANGGLSVSA